MLCLSFPPAESPVSGASSFDRFWPSSADRTVLMEGESVASRGCSIACLVDINTKVALRPVRDYCAAVAQGGGCLFGCLAKDLNATAVVSRAASLAETSNRWATGSGPAWTTGDPSPQSY